MLKQVIEGMGLDGNKVLRSIQHKEVADKQAEITHYVQSFGKHPTPYYLVDGEIWDKTFDTLELKELITQRAKDVA